MSAIHCAHIIRFHSKKKTPQFGSRVIRRNLYCSLLLKRRMDKYRFSIPFGLPPCCFECLSTRMLALQWSDTEAEALDAKRAALAVLGTWLDVAIIAPKKSIFAVSVQYFDSHSRYSSQVTAKNSPLSFSTFAFENSVLNTFLYAPIV